MPGNHAPGLLLKELKPNDIILISKWFCTNKVNSVAHAMSLHIFVPRLQNSRQSSLPPQSFGSNRNQYSKDQVESSVHFQLVVVGDPGGW